MSLTLECSLKIISNNAKNIETGIDSTSTADAFRFMRNSCGTNPEVQKILLKDNDVLSSTKRILLHIMANSASNQEHVLCLQVGLQFIANLIVGNTHNQEQVWINCQDLLHGCLKFTDSKVKNYCAMILYNIFLGKPEYLNQLEHPYEDLIELTMNADTSEFALYSLEHFALKSNYIQRFYNVLKPESRLIIIEVIKNLISGQHNHNIQLETINFFSHQFIKNSDCILKTNESYTDSLDPVETVKILDLLVSFSSNDQKNYLKFIQNETSLLINCIMLLKNIHSISKQSGNNFTIISKLSEFSEIEKNTSIQNHPVFGFKNSLIRLIGNFCWKNEANQNKVRELDCIPVLLDCCNMDARNPFIIQWCILAIRNVCENNLENQKVIASMSKEGKIDAAKLQEIGIVLNSEGVNDVICIAPLELSNNKVP